MGELSIKIRIADREYPMKVKSEDEERIRKAGKKINEQLKFYREKFGIEDKQDLLAMVAFDSLVEKLQSEEDIHGYDESISEKVDELNKLLSDHLV
ncbi:MAG: cell division protein ZapA [Bacteroidota bacterium]